MSQQGLNCVQEAPDWWLQIDDPERACQEDSKPESGRAIVNWHTGVKHMSNTSARLRTFFRSGAAISALTFAMGTAFAQTPPAPAPAPADAPETVKPATPAPATDRVVVTGSRIARDAFTSSSPITVITAESAQLEGLVDTADILQGSTVASGSTQINNQFGGFVVEGGTGVNTVSLRGLGAQRSLVLLNGKRPGPAGTRGQVGAFDLNVIPDSIISRVEILKDGASSIYGSDAVAGVANIITRSSIDKPELTAQVNDPEDSGGRSYQINGAFGLDFDWGGTLMVAAEYENRAALKRGDRSWSRCNKELALDPVTGNIIDRQDRSILAGGPLEGCNGTNIYFNTVIAGATRYIPSPTGNTVGPIPGYRPRFNPSYLTSPTGQAYYEDVLNSEKYLEGDILSAVERTSLYAKYDQDIAGMQWSTEALMTRRETASRQWRQFFPLIAPNNQYDVATGPNSPFTTRVQPVTIWPSNDDIAVDYYYINTGLKGDFGGGTGYLSTWSWDVNASFSRSDGTYTGNEILLETAGDWNYASPSDGLYHGPTYNAFDPAFLSGNYSQATYDLLTSIETGNTTYDQTLVSGVVTGDLFTLPAGPVGLAVGAEFREFKINDVPSERSQNNELWGTSSALITKGKDKVTELYAEIDVPLLKGLPFIEDLNFNGSARTFDYDSYGSDSVWKAGLNWQIIPSLRVRGTKGTSYRAPALYELYLGNQTAFLSQLSIDPCDDWGNSSNENIRANCAAAGIPSNYAATGSSALIVTGGGAGVLSAETSEASTLGVIWTPSFLDLSFAVDYFDITINDQVAQLGAGSILGGCYGAPVYPNAFCGLFTRAPASDPLRPNQIIQVNDSYLNVNQQATHGLDFAVRYQHEFNFGELTVDVNATHTLEDVSQLFDSSQASGYETNDFNGTIGEPKWTGDAQFSLRRGDFTYSWFVDYIGKSDNAGVIANEFYTYQGRSAQRIIRTDDWLSHDISIRWSGDSITLTGGIANMFNAQPPIVSNGAAQRLGNTALAGTQYDLLGRTLFLRATKKF